MPSQSTIHAYSTSSGDWVKVSSDSTGRLNVALFDADGTQVGVDSECSALKVMQPDEYHVHEGVFFDFTFLGTCAAGATLTLLIATGNTNTVHTRFKGTTDAAIDFYLTEKCSCTALGTELSSYDMNRTTDNSPGTKFYSSPTVIGAGATLISAHSAAGGTRQSLSGGESAGGANWLLATATHYLMKAHSRAAVGSAVQMEVEFAEH